MFQAQGQLTLGQPSGDSAAAPATPAKSSYLPLILVLAAVFLFVVIIILFFAFRRH
jgi:hypothetical protein